MKTPERGGWLIVTLLALGAIYQSLEKTTEPLLGFVKQYIPGWVGPVAFLVAILTFFGPAFAPVMSYMLNPRRLFSGEESDAPPPVDPSKEV